jgi:hypothetical protein
VHGRREADRPGLGRIDGVLVSRNLKVLGEDGAGSKERRGWKRDRNSADQKRNDERGRSCRDDDGDERALGETAQGNDVSAS